MNEYKLWTFFKYARTAFILLPNSQYPDCFLDDEIKNIGLYYYISGLIFLCAHDIIMSYKYLISYEGKPAGTL